MRLFENAFTDGEGDLSMSIRRFPMEPCRTRSSLPLLVARIGADDEHDAAAADDLAILTNASNAASYFHDLRPSSVVRRQSSVIAVVDPQ